jgi:hypothetical protein
VTAPDLAAAILRVEARSTRSRQRKIGASELGTCRRRTAYRIAGTKATNPPTGLQAFLGTAIHKAVLAVAKREHGAVTEIRLDSPVVKGHADAVYFHAADPWAADPVWSPAELRQLTAADLEGTEVLVEDLKTKGRFTYETVVEHGPRLSEWFQIHIYAWLLMTGQVVDRRLPAGVPFPVKRVALRFVDRDTGRQHVVETDYDPAITVQALAWLADVQGTVEENGPEAAPRDGYGPDVSAICDHCPFLDQCWGPPIEGPGAPMRQSLEVHDDPTIEAALVGYALRRDEEKVAKEAKAGHRAQLDGAPVGVYGEWKLSWSEKVLTEVPDGDAAIARLRDLGEEVPTRWTGGGRTIRVTRQKPKGKG